MPEKISRSEQKRHHKQIEEVAKALAGLSNRDLKDFPGSDEIKEEIVSIRSLKGGARKRQIKHLTKVLKKGSVSEIYDFLSKRNGSHLKDKSLFHEAERLRDALINEALETRQYCTQNAINWEPDRVTELVEKATTGLTSLDTGVVRKLVYQYARTRNKVHYREIFRMILAALELEERR